MKDLAHVAHALAQPDQRPILARRELSERLISLFRADFLGQTQWNPEKGVFEKPLCYNRDQRMSWEFEAYYQHCDPISKHIRTRREATSTYEVISRRRLERSEYYCDFLQPHGVSHGLDQYLFEDGRIIGDFRVWRKSASFEFGRREKHLLSALHPMLKNAYSTMPYGDDLEQAVSGHGLLAVAMSADLQRYICSPALIDWIAHQNDLSESAFKNAVLATVRGKKNTASFPRFELRIGWRNVPVHSDCAILCTVIPRSGNEGLRQPGLTMREEQVTALVAEGLTDREISNELGIAFWTVRTHVGNSLRKLGARNRTELARHAGRPRQRKSARD
ncbi:helix-turn-helix domain-containing protein [Hoeflea poritis]|uniref:Helix-turn-helix transcriptional regulator n=1 Tax=Hoeflea poritis TaxID=2993659 RepID=A0ABT4VJH4_9HYPH|nr:helix-turn-helix transcriptional regulator [Hoeflea poritis]MDA4844863.1 helix-turn-helix transcriptional regulator [Hoeflea poritis]